MSFLDALFGLGGFRKCPRCNYPDADDRPQWTEIRRAVAEGQAPASSVGAPRKYDNGLRAALALDMLDGMSRADAARKHGVPYHFAYRLAREWNIPR